VILVLRLGGIDARSTTSSSFSEGDGWAGIDVFVGRGVGSYDSVFWGNGSGPGSIW